MASRVGPGAARGSDAPARISAARIAARRTSRGRISVVWAAAACAAIVAAPSRALAQATPTPLTTSVRQAIVDSVARALVDGYVFADVALEMQQHIRARLGGGAYDTIGTVPGLAQMLTDDLRSIRHDKHLRVVYVSPDSPDNAPDATEAERERRQVAEGRRRNFGFQKVERLEGNVGYLELRSFFDALHAGETAIAAMNFLGNVDALIIDLRQNGGGEPNMIQLLLSYLFDRPTHLNDFVTRPDGRTRQYWTHAKVSGPSLSGAPVYVLTSGFTFSAAEEFAYDLKSYRRATIVGEQTGGGAHMVRLVRFPSLQAGVMVPFGRAVNPNTGTNWEGVGVTPDIRVPAEQALAAAHLDALTRLRDRAQDPGLRRSYEWAMSGVVARRNAITLDAVALEACVGTYGPRRVTREGSFLYYQREGRSRMRLIPAGADLFLVEGMEAFRVRFGRDESGAANRIVGLYEDGRTDENLRTGR